MGLGAQRGEGAHQAALEEVLFLIEGAELLLGLAPGGLQPGGELFPQVRQRLQPGLDVLIGVGGPLLRLQPGGRYGVLQALPLGAHELLLFGPHLFQPLRQLVVDGLQLGQPVADLDGAAHAEDDVRQMPAVNS